jgi:ferredoxin
MRGAFDNMFQKKSGGTKDTTTVTFKPSNIVVEAKVGDGLSAVAEAAGVDIKHKCKKGECGTCQVNIDGKWVKTCQTIIPTLKKGEVFEIEIRPAPPAAKKPSKFFSPASFAEGIINNGLGVVGFVAKGIAADDEFEARMKREAELAAKLEAKRKQNQ